MRLSIAFITILAAGCGQKAPVAPPPNLVIILCDDLGTGDLGCYGCEAAHTEHIDSIARRGVRFTQAYATSAACSPSRAGLLTGRHPSRFGHEFNLPNTLLAGPARARIGLPVSETTIADSLRTAGYRTGLVGKWHLGSDAHFHPLNRGFDEFYGFLHGPPRYRSPSKTSDGDQLRRGNEPLGYRSEHLTDLFAQEAVSFIERTTEQPFFLFLSLKAPHGPLEPSAADEALFSDVEDESRRKYLALMAGADRAVGSVLDALGRRGIEDDTLLVFASDHGAHTKKGGSNAGLRGMKGSLFEGGLRVPLLVQWPSRFPAGRTSDALVSLLDIYPTFLAAARGELSAKLEGADLAPLLEQGDVPPPHEWLAWRTGLNGALRSGNWKVITCRDEPVGLFDLAADPNERTNLVDRDAARAAELTQLFLEWDRERVEPLWTSGNLSMAQALGRR